MLPVYLQRQATAAGVAALVCSAVAVVPNIGFSIHLWVTRESLWWAMAPIFETLVFVWLMAAAAISSVKRQRRGLAAAAAALFAIVVLFSAAEALFLYIYGRHFVPVADIPMARGGLLLLFGEIGALADVLTPIAIALILAVAVAVGWSFAWITNRALQRVAQPLLGAAVLTIFAGPLVVLLGAPQVVSTALIRSLRPAASYEFVEVTTHHDQHSGAAADAHDSPETPATDAGVPEDRESAAQYALPGIRDRDIYVFVIEAYGKAAFSRDTLYRELEPSYNALVEVLEREGYHIKSRFIESPVAGGFSWLAEATFLTGQNIDVEPKFDALLDSGAGSLPRMLYANNYYTMMVRPGTVHGRWPEGWDFYRFEDAMVAYDGDFGYTGPGFSFVPIPDQFAIWRAHKRLEEVRAEGGPAAERPIYIHYQLVSSHTPFNRIPPYIEDWDTLGDGSVYHERADEILTFDNTWGGGRELDEGYAASIEYVFTAISEYLDRFVDHEGDPILIFFGDHQPQRPIREADATLAVPIHVAARDREILGPLAEYGYTAGFTPQQQRPHPHFTEFYPMFAEIARRGRVVERPRQATNP